MNTFSSKAQTQLHCLLEMLTLVCPQCGWQGNDNTCKKLTIGELQYCGVMDNNGFIIKRFKDWNYSYCPKCSCTNLLRINQKEYAEKINETMETREEDKEWLNRQRRC